MKLAYAAYKPLKGQFSDIAPGKFMEPDIRSAQEELDDYGFESSIYNDGDNDTVCHVIGHKQIYANINYDTSDNTNGGANNATFGVYKNVSGSGLERGFSWDDSSGLRSDDYNNSVFTSSGRYSEAFWKALNSDGANNTDFMIKTNTNTNGGNNNGYLGILEGTGRCKPIGVFSGSNQSGLRTDDFVGTVGSNCTGNSEIFGNTLNSDGANDTDCVIKTNTNGGNNNGTLGILEGTGKHGTIGYFSDDFQSGLRTDVSMDSTWMSCVGSSEAFWNTLNSNGANNTDCMRTLVVVDIRGLSTTNDWWTDIGTQLNPKWGSFGAEMETVLKSLYHGTGNTENFKMCNGNSNGCAYCKGYIPFNNISNPIFLVTGHSLGATVANLLAEHLNSCKDTNHCRVQGLKKIFIHIPLLLRSSAFKKNGGRGVINAVLFAKCLLTVATYGIK